MIGFTAVATFIILKLVGLVIPLRMTEAEMEQGDIAVHGHEVYPSDIPSLGYTGGSGGLLRRHRRGPRAQRRVTRNAYEDHRLVRRHGL